MHALFNKNNTSSLHCWSTVKITQMTLKLRMNTRRLSCSTCTILHKSVEKFHIDQFLEEIRRHMLTEYQTDITLNVWQNVYITLSTLQQQHKELVAKYTVNNTTIPTKISVYG